MFDKFEIYNILLRLAILNIQFYIVFQEKTLTININFVLISALCQAYYYFGIIYVNRNSFKYTGSLIQSMFSLPRMIATCSGLLDN